ncbi:UNVERIFIED_CONTAM: hypothetical protein Sradi_3001300 [Sesamum radiatum]|uniref:Transposase MuDR plant domain-containing protein n=1 Tax=Sesamum radiatum TaxID=300843 RepID=A0AAW2S1T6_SESRA
MSLRHQVLVDLPDPKYQKYGKGVVVENEDNSEFDDSEWDEVFNIVDSYANDYEQGGVESQNEGEGEEESDRLYESEYEMNVDDDTEQGDQTEHGGLDNVEESGDDSHEGEASDPEEAATESDVEETDDDFDSVAGSDEEDKVPKCVFNPRNKYNPHFEIGMIFSNKVELRDAIHSHAVSTKRSLKIMKNDKRRVYVKCLGDGCQWRLNALKLGGESTFQIREYNSKHKCARSFNVKNVNSKWLSAKYEDAFRTDPKRNVKGFRKDVIKEIRCHVSKNQAYRAKKKALNAIEGKAEDQFECLWDYAAELRSSNPGSTVQLVMNDGGNGTGQRKFSKFYVCFDAFIPMFFAFNQLNPRFNCPVGHE